LAACNVQVDAVDVPEFAQRNLAHGGSADPGKSDAWLAFDQDTFLLTVHCMGELAFARRMLLPNAALSAETDADPVAHFVERVVLQVQRSLDLFERQSGLPAVTQICIGPHPHAAAIADELRQRSFAHPVLAESTEPLRCAAAASNGAFAAELTGVIGAALRAPAGKDGVATIQSIDLNLQGHTHRADVPFRLPLAVALAAIVAGLGALAWTEKRAVELQRATAAQLVADVKRAEQALATLQQRTVALAETPASAEADVAALEALASRLGEIASVRHEPFTGPLRALARARAEGVWLTGIRLGHGQGPMVLEGRALDASRVPQWLAALQSEPRFAGTAVARIDLQPARDPAGAVQFHIGTDAGTSDAGAGR
jgi:Tfp pilus assembly protein PilN